MLLLNALLSLVTLVSLLLSIALYTLAERKVMAAIQRRHGPIVVGFKGILQPFADGLKLVLKEIVVPHNTNRFVFILSPCFLFIVSFMNWLFVPMSFNEVLVNAPYNLLIVYAVSSLSVYGIIIAGWVSQSKYPFLGAIRSVAQMLSYEVSIGTIFLVIAFLSESMNLMEIVYTQNEFVNYFLLMPGLAVLFGISIIAETNRAPFDLPEAEAELVAGYNLEYSSMLFAFFFLAEYGNMIFMSTLFVILFWAGWGICPYILSYYAKILLVCFLFIVVRAALPRYRYEQLMAIGWKFLFPLNFLVLILVLIFFL